MAIDTTHGISSAPSLATRIHDKLSGAIPLVFAAAVFSSAFLLFLVQPLLGKYILPWFGGSPSVWTTCMLLFQLLLFFGYGYAHLLSCLSPRRQAFVHISLLLGALWTLPITPAAAWKPTDISNPTGQIILLLLACVGLPYFLLSATGPLLQSWFARSQPGVSPYRLYALSNVGSLLALLAYPFLIERWLSKPNQTWAWSGAFVLFAALCALCAILAGRTNRRTVATDDSRAADGSASAPTFDMIGAWFSLAMIASMLLLATTNQVCLDVAVIPFLWVIPLALYLLTFIFCFDGEHWYRRRLFLAVALVTMPMAWFLTLLPANGSLLLQLGIYFAALFSGCMFCHGELVRLKPESRYLTLFYLTISAGGSCGGLFVGLLAPAVFIEYFEFQLAIVGFVLLALFVLLRESINVRARKAVGLTAMVVWGLGLALFVAMGRHDARYLDIDRNFYGTLKVEREVARGSYRAPRLLIHGRIVHGAQNVASANRRMEPTTYYGRQSGVGVAFAHVNRKPQRHVGVIGLGIGTLATYGREGDRFRFYEINPAVVDFAKSYFTFLAKCPAEHTCVVGDARLELEREAPQAFDLLVLDAFSGDAIPVHLLTREAFAVYLQHLSPEGLLACHISNVHFDLLPVLAGIADELGLAVTQIDSEGNPAAFQTDATWVILARDSTDLPKAENARSLNEVRRTYWTDDRNNLFEVLTQ